MFAVGVYLLLRRLGQRVVEALLLSVAALLTELFPPRIRYSSMSIPYHFGTGYFGGLLPFVEQYIVARSGNPFAGLWYSWCVVAMALGVTLLLLRENDLSHR